MPGQAPTRTLHPQFSSADLALQRRGLMRETLDQWAGLSQAEWPAFSQVFQPADFAANEVLVAAGDVNPHVFFVTDGLLRFYYLDREGCEWNKSFATQGSFAGVMSSFALGVPSPFTIEALKPTQVLMARWADVENLYDKYPALNRLGRRVAERLLVQKELRERSFLELDATQRYQALCDERPDLVEQLPNYHIASYLGITEVSLSRLRRKLNTG